MNEMIKVIVKTPGEEYGHVTHVRNTLENFQKLVDGSIETFPVGKRAVIVCNEYGKLRGLVPNFIIAKNGYRVDTFVGTIVVVGVSGEKFCDLDMSYDFWKKLIKEWGN